MTSLKRRILLSVSALLAAITMVVAPSTPALAYTSSWDSGTSTLTITGTAADDTLTLTCSGGLVSVNAVNDVVLCNVVVNLVVNGGGGNDTLNVGGVLSVAGYTVISTVAVSGGDGSDYMAGAPVPETMDGGADNDYLLSSAGSDQLNGGPGSDVIVATGDLNWTVTDTQLSPSGTDTLSSIERAEVSGGPSGNTLDATGFSGPVSMFGAGGNDTLSSGPGQSSLSGGDGGDTLNGGSGDDYLTGDESVAGNDVMHGAGGVDVLQADVPGSAIVTNSTMSGMGSDTFDGIEEAHVNTSSAGTINASAFSGFARLMVGTGGTAIGGSGDDFLQGTGAATLTGNAGNDSVLFGRDGNWTVSSTTATNSIYGATTLSSIELLRIHTWGGATQSIDVSAWLANAELSAFSGVKTLVGNGAKTELILYPMGGTMTLTNSHLTSTDLDLTYTGVGGIVEVDVQDPTKLAASRFRGKLTFLGSSGNDSVVSGRGKDILVGYSGRDTLKSGRGADKLYGGDDSDKLDGGRGADGCNGGKGRDTEANCERHVKDTYREGGLF